MTDPIADMLTRIRNALLIRRREVVIPFSKIKSEIARIMKENGFIVDYTQLKDGQNHNQIKVILSYTHNNQPVLRSLKKISRAGCRIYVDKDSLPVVLNNKGVAIISTSQGLMTNKEAKKKQVGGEVICEIY